MQAAHYRERGAARDVLRVGNGFDTPEPGPGEVRVRVHASGVNPSDVKGRGITRGNARMAWPVVIPHQDGAGVIDAVGAGVDRKRIGQRVWLFMAQSGRAFGTAAESCVLPEWRAVPLPDDTGFAEGAMLGVPAMTAHYALFDSAPIDGKRVLVQGGAGAVGFYAVQLAKLGGAASVIATVSRDEQAAEAKRAGADIVINRREQDVVASLRDTFGEAEPIHRIVEVAFGANQAADLALLAPGGVVAAYGSDAVPEPPLGFWDWLAKDATLRILLIYRAGEQRLGRAAKDLGAWMRQGLLQHPRASTFRLADIVAAHEAVEAGRTVGKVILDIGGDAR